MILAGNLEDAAALIALLRCETGATVIYPCGHATAVPPMSVFPPSCPVCLRRRISPKEQRHDYSP